MDLPNYVRVPLRGFLDYIKESMNLLHASMQGISMIMAIPNAVKVLEKTDHSAYNPAEVEQRNEKYKKDLEEAESAAEFAQKEVKHGFPLLQAHTLVGLWSALESALEDLVVGVLMNEPDLVLSEVFSRIRVPLAEFESLEKDERMRFLIEEVERGQGLGKKRGVDGFEVLLASVGLAGSVDQELKKILWEISHVRNVIVHRGAVADRRLVQSCPWMGIKVGEKVSVSHEALERYANAFGEYLVVILHRVHAKYATGVSLVERHLPA